MKSLTKNLNESLICESTDVCLLTCFELCDVLSRSKPADIPAALQDIYDDITPKDIKFYTDMYNAVKKCKGDVSCEEVGNIDPDEPIAEQLYEFDAIDDTSLHGFVYNIDGDDENVCVCTFDPHITVRNATLLDRFMDALEESGAVIAETF